ncbi:MAG: ATP-binding protein [Burkholderiaceae bacterium]
MQIARALRPTWAGLHRPRSSARGRYRFWRWFMALSLLIIVVNSAVFSWLLAGFLERRMLERDVTVAMEFVNSIVRVQRAGAYFHGQTMDASVPEMEEFFAHVASLPGVFRANVYGQDRSVLWSSDPALIGRHFKDNDELEATFRGELEPEIESVDRGKKPEHVNFPPGIDRYIENYLPIWSSDRRHVVGAVEIYKHPTALLEAIHQGQVYVWMGTACAALILYLGLGLVVIHAQRVLRDQEAQNVEMERLAVVGEMASAVAHGLRNPLAAIRSCAELALDDDLSEQTRESIGDIVSQSDRLEGWIRSFLRRARQDGDSASEVVAVDDVVRECLAGFSAQLAARGIRTQFDASGDSPLAHVPRNELNQVLNSVVSNSIEAMKEEGLLTITRERDQDGMVCVVIADTGPGIPASMIGTMFTPFMTTKSSGLGIGLALARRIIERIGGSMELANRPERGAIVRVLVPAAVRS